MGADIFDVRIEFLVVTVVSLLVWSEGCKVANIKHGWWRGLYFEGKDAVVAGRILKGIAFVVWLWFAAKFLTYLIG